VFDGASRAYSIAAGAEYDAIVWFLHGRSFLAVFLFKFECSKFAVFHAFSAAETSFIVYRWKPRNFASGNPVPSLLGHFEDLDWFRLVVILSIATFKYCS